jgi:2'-hydroxyisoflavone reductase
MKLLMLGGTGFLGTAVVASALARGWSVTVFNRGVTGAAPDGVERRYGDRHEPDGLTALDGGAWDVVVDTWDGEPRAALASARALHGRVGHYTYVSSRSVYADPVALGIDETAPIVAARSDAADGEYPQLKAGSERAVLEVFGDRALLARAGLIIGPGEDGGRLPWWLQRIAAGGDVLAPGPLDLPLQYVDARDLANWLLDNAAAGTAGAVNVVSRTGHATMGQLLDACVAATGSSARLHWTESEPILAAGVRPWIDLPIWVPIGHKYRWLHEADVSRAYATGLQPRPIAETVADTWAWLEGISDLPAKDGRPVVGLDPEIERAILAGR